MSRLELLSPAGDLEKLKMAVVYGADAVYFGGERYGLRAQAGNLTLADIQEGIKFAHSRGCKAYITMNIFARDSDLTGMPSYVRDIIGMGIDAIILSDPGVFDIVRRISDNIDIHISTQANITNSHSVNFWHRMGAKRVVLARELTLDEIKAIKNNISNEIELEVFVHGAMCISYSGRCLLSSYLTNRDANRGSCSHPCRWKYALVEETRPGKYLPILEDEAGTFIMNSKDLCMIDYLQELTEAGVASIKIEGRMKSVYYTALVTKAYRDRLDGATQGREQELHLDVSHREYGTGFYFGQTDDMQIYNTSSYIRAYDFIGLIKGYNEKLRMLKIEQRNNFKVNDEVEIIIPDQGRTTEKLNIERMYDDEMTPIDCARHPKMQVLIPSDVKYPEYSILRRKRKD